jgi:hypothetical protein
MAMFEFVTDFWLRALALIKRRKLDLELEEEMSFHLALREARHQASGVSADEARAAARREFGNVTTFKEACRDMWTFVWLENLATRVKWRANSVRRWRKSTATYQS